MRFIDEVKIYLKAGDGGNGAASFRREKYIPFGGPNGGNGGNGGSIIIQADLHLNTLIDYRYKQHFKVKTGEHGKGKDRYGKASEDLLLKVPVGTQIYAEDGDTLIADLVEVGQTITIAEGGRGGLGNANFKTSINQAPRQITPGKPGEELWVWMKMKIISDAGIIGLPNAGKSTLLSVISAAKPKIADYAFTTLKPQLGTVRVGYDSFVIADIPGLIEGASKGIGIGDKFLKHIERCGILVHLIDISAEDIYANYCTVRNEIAEYGNEVASKDEVIVLNKIELLTEKECEKIKKNISKKTGKEVLMISCATMNSIQDLIYYIHAKIKDRRENPENPN